MILKTTRKWLVLPICFLIEQHTSFADEKSHIPPVRIIINKNNIEITPQQFISQLKEKDAIIIGEEHNNKKHHHIELWIITELQKIRANGSILLEMLDEDQQSNIQNLYYQKNFNKRIKEDEIRKILNWSPAWPWHNYKDIILHALRYNTPIIPANTSSLNKINKEFYTMKSSQEIEISEKIADLITHNHHIELSNKKLLSMVTAQRYLDYFMAGKLYTSKYPAILITGYHHASLELGIPLYYHEMSGSIPTVIILSSNKEAVSTMRYDYLIASE